MRVQRWPLPALQTHCMEGKWNQEVWMFEGMACAAHMILAVTDQSRMLIGHKPSLAAWLGLPMLTWPVVLELRHAARPKEALPKPQCIRPPSPSLPVPCGTGSQSCQPGVGQHQPPLQLPRPARSCCCGESTRESWGMSGQLWLILEPTLLQSATVVTAMLLATHVNVLSCLLASSRGRPWWR